MSDLPKTNQKRSVRGRALLRDASRRVPGVRKQTGHGHIQTHTHTTRPKLLLPVSVCLCVSVCVVRIRTCDRVIFLYRQVVGIRAHTQCMNDTNTETHIYTHAKRRIRVAERLEAPLFVFLGLKSRRSRSHTNTG